MRIPTVVIALFCVLVAAPGWAEDLSAEEIELLNEECLDCHADLDEDEEEYAFPDGSVITFSVDADEHRASVHGRVLACVSCHEDYADEHPDFEPGSAQEHRRARSELCASCHEELVCGHPEDEEDGPLCVDCHSAHSDRSFEEFPSVVIARCGGCHDAELEEYQAGGHAEAGSASDPNPDMPRCFTCHPVHEKAEGAELPLIARVTKLCIDCHSSSRLVLEYDLGSHVVTSYMEDFHGMTFQHLLADVDDAHRQEIMTCATCHGPHAVGPVEKERLAEVCLDCHEEASAGFTGAWLGHELIGPGNAILVWAVQLGYGVLIPLMLVGLITIILVQLQHHFRTRRGATDSESGKEEARQAGMRLSGTVVRFSRVDRAEHVLVMILFSMLVATGIPQSYPQSNLASAFVDFWGGIAWTRLIHRTCGFVFAALMAAHVVRGIVGTIRRHRHPEILPTATDFRHIFEDLRHHLGMGPAPRFDKFDYGEKFEYMGLFLGGCLIAGTGFLLVFPEFATTYLPGVVLTAARVAHGYEATLAVLVIVVWHLWGVALRPGVFPCDTSIFTGRMDVERLREEHHLWYDRLLAERGQPSMQTASGSDVSPAAE